VIRRKLTKSAKSDCVESPTASPTAAPTPICPACDCLTGCTDKCIELEGSTDCQNMCISACDCVNGCFEVCSSGYDIDECRSICSAACDSPASLHKQQVINV
jgi:hypothetical protein